MGTNLFPGAYEELIKEDIVWLEDNTERSLERSHIIEVLKHAVKEYRIRGYDEAMTETGPHIEPSNGIHGEWFRMWTQEYNGTG